MLNVFPISEDIKEGRHLEQKDEESSNPFVRYPRSDVILGIKPDVASIFLDLDAEQNSMSIASILFGHIVSFAPLLSEK